MSAYANALHNVALAGPTLFGQVINTAAEIAGQSISYNRNKYFVLLIITVNRMQTLADFIFIEMEERDFMYTGCIHKALLKRMQTLFDVSFH